MADFDERYEIFEVEDLSLLEYLERRNIYTPQHRKNDLDELDGEDFRRRYRLHKTTVEEIVRILQPKLDSITSRNKALSSSEKVLAALRFFSFGSQQINIGDLQTISQPSASRAINDVSKCLTDLRPTYIYLPQTERDRMEISQKFYMKYGFPSVYGALDCTLIKILNPGGRQAETFRCRKGFFALNVQTLSDEDMFIRNLVVRWPGSTHDSTIFDHSYLRAHLETEVPNRYHVLGDSGYPLRPYLMTPFLNPVDANQIRYNAAHARARNVVERQYGIWKKRFSCIGLPLRCRLANAQNIIVATAVLHNIALSLGDIYEDQESFDVDENIHINHTQTVAGIAKRNLIVSSYFNN